MDRTGLDGAGARKVQRDFVRSRLEGSYSARAYELLVPVFRQKILLRSEAQTSQPSRNVEHGPESLAVGA